MTQLFDPFEPGAWADQPGCEPFEIALMMRARGGLAPSADAILDAHLASCPSCPELVNRIAQVDAALAARSTADVHGAEPQVARRKLASYAERYRTRTPKVLVVSGVCGLAIAVLEHLIRDDTRWPLFLASSSVVFAALFAMFTLVYRRHLRRLRGLLEQPDVIATYRSELERRIERSKRSVGLLVAAVAFSLVNVGLTYADAMDGFAHAQRSFVESLIWPTLLSLSIASTWRDRRAALRELAELH
jgi:anti-sigma factor RsiW